MQTHSLPAEYPWPEHEGQGRPGGDTAEHEGAGPTRRGHSRERVSSRPQLRRAGRRGPGRPGWGDCSQKLLTDKHTAILETPQPSPPPRSGPQLPSHRPAHTPGCAGPVRLAPYPVPGPGTPRLSVTHTLRKQDDVPRSSNASCQNQQDPDLSHLPASQTPPTTCG